MGDNGEEEPVTFSEHLACTHCGLSFDEPAPRNFSFNSPYGACPSCDGLGTRYEVDPELVVPDGSRSIADGAIVAWSGPRGMYFNRLLEAVADTFGFEVSTPWEKLRKKDRKVLLYGAGGRQVQLKYKNRYGRQRSFQSRYEGVVPWLQRRHSEAESDSFRESIEAYMREVPCPACGGARLKPESLAVKVGSRNIFELCSLSITRAASAVDEIELTEREHMIADRVLREVKARMQVPLGRRTRLSVARARYGHVVRR